MANYACADEVDEEEEDEEEEEEEAAMAPHSELRWWSRSWSDATETACH